MARRSEEENNATVEVEFEKILHHTPGAVLFLIEGAETWIGKGPIENLDDIEEKIKDPDVDVDRVEVPKWLAVDNGWDEWDDE
jgi:hypothetical protein